MKFVVRFNYLSTLLFNFNPYARFSVWLERRRFEGKERHFFIVCDKVGCGLTFDMRERLTFCPHETTEDFYKGSHDQKRRYDEYLDRHLKSLNFDGPVH